jgi:hypothetical protein
LSPPQIQVNTTYTGAGAQEAAGALVTPLEQEINGAENLIHIPLNITITGQVPVEATFKDGYDLNSAAPDLLTRVSQAQLSETVANQEVEVLSTGNQMLGTVVIYPDGNAGFDELSLSNHAEAQVNNQLLRVNGIGNVRNLISQRFATQVWLDLTRVEALALDSSAVLAVVREQNVHLTAGSVGCLELGSDSTEPHQLLRRAFGHLGIFQASGSKCRGRHKRRAHPHGADVRALSRRYPMHHCVLLHDRRTLPAPWLRAGGPGHRSSAHGEDGQCWVRGQ